MHSASKPLWQQATAVVSLSASGAITGFTFVPKAAADLTSPTGMHIRLLALRQAGQPAPANDAMLRSAIVDSARYYLRMAADKTPAEMEAIIWQHDSSDGADHGQSCAAFASLTLELGAQVVGQQSWVTGGTSYPWPLNKWADVRVDPNPASLGIVSIQQDAQANGRWHLLGDGYRPLPGDWVLFAGHVEVVTDYADGVLRTIGGDSLPNYSVNAHQFRDPLASDGVAGFVNNGELSPGTPGSQAPAAPGTSTGGTSSGATSSGATNSDGTTSGEARSAATSAGGTSSGGHRADESVRAGQPAIPGTGMVNSPGSALARPADHAGPAKASGPAPAQPASPPAATAPGGPTGSASAAAHGGGAAIPGAPAASSTDTNSGQRPSRRFIRRRKQEERQQAGQPDGSRSGPGGQPPAGQPSPGGAAVAGLPAPGPAAPAGPPREAARGATSIPGLPVSTPGPGQAPSVPGPSAGAGSGSAPSAPGTSPGPGSGAAAPSAPTTSPGASSGAATPSAPRTSPGPGTESGPGAGATSSVARKSPGARSGAATPSIPGTSSGSGSSPATAPGTSADPGSGGAGSSAPGDSSASGSGAAGSSAPGSSAGPAPAGAAAGPAGHSAAPHSRNHHSAGPGGQATPVPDISAQQAFIAEVAPAAIDSQRKYGVPASVTIAQAIDESAWGQSALASKDHNLFGIKGTGPAGSDSMPTLEYENGQPVTRYAPFRVYHDLAESIDDHGKLLATSPYYRRPMADRRDPNAFAAALTGIYATDPDYGAKLISLMRQYNLYRYDGTSPAARPHPASAPGGASIPGLSGVAAVPRANTPPSARPDKPAADAPSAHSASAHPQEAPTPSLQSMSAVRIGPPDRPRAVVPPRRPPATASAQPGRRSSSGSRSQSGGRPTSRTQSSRALAQPDQAESDQAQPDQAQPDQTSPAKTSPAKTSPAKTSPGKMSPARMSPAKTSPAQASRTKTSRAQASRARTTRSQIGSTQASSAQPGQAEADGAQPIRGQASGAQASGRLPADTSGWASSPWPGGGSGTRSGPRPSRAQASGSRPSRGQVSGPAPARSRSRASTSKYRQELPAAVKTAFLTTARVPLLRQEPLYRDVAADTGVRWELLAACDWMQCEAQPRFSPVHGEKLGKVTPEGMIYPTKSAALEQCAEDLAELAWAVYQIDLTRRESLSIRELANAFAAFRWGGLLRLHHTSAMEFPYSVAGLTEHHLNMRWPKIPDSNLPDKPGGRFRKPFGAVPIVLSLHYPATVQ